MSHITLAQQGLAAAEARNWDEAITKLSKALRSSTNPAWLLTRSRALINSRRFQEALDDANLAWHTAYQRNKRPLMVEAHYRRAVAYFRLGQYANADCCCIYAMRLSKGFGAIEKQDPAAQFVDESGFWKATAADATTEAQDEEADRRKGDGSGMDLSNNYEISSQVKEWRRASTLRIQILTAMAALPADDPARKVTTGIKPEEKKLADIKPENDAPESRVFNPSVSGATTPASPITTAAAKSQVRADTQLRLQEFQSSTTMSVSIFSKGVNKEKLQVEFSSSSVLLNPMVYPSGEEKEFQLRLWGEIDPSSSKYTVTPNKVELSLAKKSAGKWPKLNADENTTIGVAVDAAAKPEIKTAEPDKASPIVSTAAEPSPTKTQENIQKESKAAPAADATTAKAPAYPSSSRSGAKDWDKVGGEENSDDEEGKDINFFFKKLYKNASPEQQRAMMKSFTESNGTSLSTDWGDVKDRTVETVPPEGVEPKKWGE